MVSGSRTESSFSVIDWASVEESGEDCNRPRSAVSCFSKSDFSRIGVWNSEEISVVSDSAVLLSAANSTSPEVSATSVASTTKLS